VLNEVEQQELAEMLSGATSSTGIVILPERRLPNGIGVYSEQLISFVKELRADGVEVNWADEPDKRSMEGKKSVAADTLSAIIGFPWGVLSNATWELIKSWFSRPPRDTQELHIGLARATEPDGVHWEWATFEGKDSGAVIDAMSAYLGFSNRTEE
jgi:hypothetical protein